MCAPRPVFERAVWDLHLVHPLGVGGDLLGARTGNPNCAAFNGYLYVVFGNARQFGDHDETVGALIDVDQWLPGRYLGLAEPLPGAGCGLHLQANVLESLHGLAETP